MGARQQTMLESLSRLDSGQAPHSRLELPGEQQPAGKHKGGLTADDSRPGPRYCWDSSTLGACSQGPSQRLASPAAASLWPQVCQTCSHPQVWGSVLLLQERQQAAARKAVPQGTASELGASSLHKGKGPRLQLPYMHGSLTCGVEGADS